MLKAFYLEIVKIFNSEHPFMLVLSNIWSFILYIWNYRIFITSDKQSILVGNIIIGIILFSVGLFCVKRISIIIKKKLTKVVDEPGVLNILDKLFYYICMMIMVIFVLDVAHVPLTIFTVIGTTLALGIGLGSQNIVNNFISGIIIMIERPIKIGDIIEVKNIVGKVINIGARCTSIKTNKNINILIPNSNILQDVIINWTLEDTILKTNFELILENNVDIDEIDNIIKKILYNHPNILKLPEPQILLKALCKQGYDIEVEFWVDLATEGKSVYIINDINRALIPILKAKSIGIIDKVTLIPTA